MNINSKNENAKLQIKRELIKKLNRLLAVTGEMRAQVDQMGTILEREHRKAA